MTAGSSTPSVTADGDKIIGGKFTVLWYERHYNKSTRKQDKYLRRRTLKLDGKRDQAEQIIEGISRFAGHILNP